ncbi:1-deoxy-D-xylulose 5-phosphate reductoisomerase [Paenibacillus darwinianus]|uniref:1-deoxy-D-xylulose 5-phosphate reductoisomerase n=1 Tax=Paenibacillus darwinianus TaxID=1380763 RepID=A0A9W5W7Z3_9BACL|nr:1-deoxy-D-xylulose-5-phosphate reductoisomerase [Paenibacillus darwinianus]EXX91260.1 1-deoxy-D-xylulose 5-phosphate reductoisomerase [Paenibacillus darwinianus]EXX92215.1 1-deoxy-D-xylulose 5-phosphate reductoisomerase [Paenibacillus darwinianus]EXX92811.1 1-deoxy-D-xylulose 5-phosphate reductoisomerase [Paenibacillus darwinianus]
MKNIAILGSTGSIGTQTLDVIANDPEQYRVTGLAAGTNVDLLVRQAQIFRPAKVCLATKAAADQAAVLLPPGIEVLHGCEGLDEIAAGTGSDYVVTALVGSQGIRSTMAAIEAGASIGLANKETLVTAGHLVMRRAAEKGVAILPVDSEHSAIFQCLNGESRRTVRKITLTASGGSFRDKTRAELEGVTVEQALNHPNWAMGAKITIDSATMVNKGLEVIEAHWLFNAAYDQIDVLLHPESIIHSYVEFVDHSVIAQLGWPDMRIPIQYALSYPDRRPTPTAPLDLAKLGKLHFREMDYARYPCLRLAYEAGRAGGSAPAVYNAANEVAVARFLKGEIAFLDIERVIATVLDAHAVCELPDLAAIAEVDERARLEASAV